MNIESKNFSLEKTSSRVVEDVATVKTKITESFSESKIVENSEFKELNEKIRIAAQYLERLDHYAEFIVIDPDTGAIQYNRSDLGKIEDNKVITYQKNFTDIIRQFAGDMERKAANLRKMSGVCDVSVVLGAIVVTFDSRKNNSFALEGDGGDLRGEYHGANDDSTGRYLGIAFIDINPEKRKKDHVSATVSAIHELQHHTLAVSDYLITKDADLDFQSNRGGRKTALYGSDRNRIQTNQAYLHDKKQFSTLLGRTFASRSELESAQKQLSYLDELHSSYLQKKDNWFNASETVYSTSGHGKHWELVGDNPIDIVAAKRLFAYIQGFYTCDKLKSSLEEASQNGQMLGAGQKKFVAEFPIIFRKVGSYIGVARTIHQAESMVAEEWRNLISKYPKLIETPQFIWMLDQWEQKGAGVDGLRNILKNT